MNPIILSLALLAVSNALEAKKSHSKTKVTRTTTTVSTKETPSPIIAGEVPAQKKQEMVITISTNDGRFVFVGPKE